MANWKPLATTSHELGHFAHYKNAKHNYNKSKDSHADSWARFVEYFLTKQEYESLGIYNDLCKYDSINKCTIPDTEYNYQAWDRTINSKQYTPLYIDLFDDFNQQTYYKNIGRYLYTNYPNDDIHMPIGLIEQIVFNTTSFSSAKQELLKFADMSMSIINGQWGLNKENINKLFKYYE